MTRGLNKLFTLKAAVCVITGCVLLASSHPAGRRRRVWLSGDFCRTTERVRREVPQSDLSPVGPKQVASCTERKKTNKSEQKKKYKAEFSQRTLGKLVKGVIPGFITATAHVETGLT